MTERDFRRVVRSEASSILSPEALDQVIEWFVEQGDTKDKDVDDAFA